MTPSPRRRGKRTVTLTYQDFLRMCLGHNLEEIDAQAFWRMALELQNSQTTEVAALTRPKVEDVIFAELRVGRDDADKLERAPQEMTQAGGR